MIARMRGQEDGLVFPGPVHQAETGEQAERSGPEMRPVFVMPKRAADSRFGFSFPFLLFPKGRVQVWAGIGNGLIQMLRFGFAQGRAPLFPWEYGGTQEKERSGLVL